MKTILFYFSATGNTLTTARIISSCLGNCELRSVSELRKARKIIVDAPSVGFVFPVYYGDMPYPVREAVSKMVFQKDAYIFIFTTCRGYAGVAAQRMDQLLRTRGQKLSCAAGIKMPGNSFLNEPATDQTYLDAQDENILAAIQPIQRREVQEFSSSEIFPLVPVDYPNNVRGLLADDSCIGCGICSQVCPMDNISIANGKAVIGDDCAVCLACFHWCPKEAIYMSRQEDIARRRKYHHPDVSLSDFIRK